jgi:hypothetical protein
MGGPTWLMGVNYYIYACTVKPYKILTVKNVLVKSVYHVMAYTIRPSAAVILHMCPCVVSVIFDHK